MWFQAVMRNAGRAWRDGEGPGHLDLGFQQRITSSPCLEEGTCCIPGPSSSQGEFCSQGVREGLIVGFIRSMCQTAQSFCDSPGEKGGATPPALLLLLSRLCLDYETATISYILTLTDEQFLVQVNFQLIAG